MMWHLSILQHDREIEDKKRGSSTEFTASTAKRGMVGSESNATLHTVDASFTTGIVIDYKTHVIQLLIQSRNKL